MKCSPGVKSLESIKHFISQVIPQMAGRHGYETIKLEYSAGKKTYFINLPFGFLLV
jgi:hypothetical protein